MGMYLKVINDPRGEFPILSNWNKELKLKKNQASLFQLLKTGNSVR